MNSGSGVPILLAVVFGSVALALFGISRSRSRGFHERGHLALSCLPWLHLLFSYAVAAYVRLGFGSWPRSCIDNPELPILDGLVLCIAVGLLLVLFFSPPLWLGWFVIRSRREMKDFLMTSFVLFVTGIVLMITAQVTDPWGFWDWVWD